MLVNPHKLTRAFNTCTYKVGKLMRAQTFNPITFAIGTSISVTGQQCGKKAECLTGYFLKMWLYLW